MTPQSSPVKSRPLSEISPMERRRNSPSFNQVTKKMIMNGRESSPFDSSPLNSSNCASPRAYWQSKDTTFSPGRYGSENSVEREHSPSPNRRSSIENLKKASRVKNSSMFAREQKNEYDPASVPYLERPLAGNRPLSVQVQGNAFGGQGLTGLRSQNTPEGFKGHRRGESHTKIPLLSPTKLSNSQGPWDSEPSPSAARGSPQRSSMSNISRYEMPRTAEDLDSSMVSEGGSQISSSTPRPVLRRHAKSVTFDEAPPKVNEYEMATPDPSSIASGSREGSYDSMDEYDDDEPSFERGSSIDHDDSFDASLEDTEKTPVVLPEDWRGMSPEDASLSYLSLRDQSRTDSIGSDGSSRPLPALPNLSTRSLPSPPRAAAISKSDILGMKESAMSLEDRLRLMHIKDTQPETSTADASPSHIASNGLGINMNNNKPGADKPAAAGILNPGAFKIPRISRESILRKVKSRTFDTYEDSTDASSPQSSPERQLTDLDLANLDPDVPIPSREASSQFDDDVPEKKFDESADEVDVYSIPDMYSVERSPSRMDDYDDALEVVDGGSQQRDGPITEGLAQNDASEHTPDKVGLPEFSSMLDDEDFKTRLSSFVSTQPEEPIAATKPPLTETKPEIQRPVTPEQELDEDEEDPGTPGSIIHHPPTIVEPVRDYSPSVPEPIATIKAPGGRLKTRASATPADLAAMAQQRRIVSGERPPPIPEKSSKRLSMSVEPEDTQSDSGIRRSASLKKKLDILNVPVAGLGDELGLDKEFDRLLEASKVDLALSSGSSLYPLPSQAQFPPQYQQEAESGLCGTAEHPSGSTFTSQQPSLANSATSQSWINANFTLRKQKGYLMRQNTKVVVASSRQFSDEKPSTAPSDGDISGSKPWTTEAWNGKMRRKSIRTTSGGSPKKSLNSPVPPLPGQESAVSGAQGLGIVMEDNAMDCFDDETGERGRLFVKVLGLKDLGMPLPSNERTNFQLTLDNGLHCVTTAWLELGRSAPINQEFELVVLNDLEFQLTLQTKLTPPPQPAQSARPTSPTKGHKAQKSTFSRLAFLSSPKKRKDAERKAAEEAAAAQRESQAQREADARRAMSAKTNPTAWDLMHNLVAQDGSFARAYVCLKSHEQNCFGRPFTVDIPCFNEWAVDDSDPNVENSVRSRRGALVRKPPYKVAHLTLQLLYVPKPKGAKDEDMPKSMSACVRELRDAEEAKKRNFEGYLSQQGGDCPYWRRRLFRLHGHNLTAYHETTHQPRATINLAKARKLIDDRSSLINPDTAAPGKKGRRKSAFAEEEEGYMFVEDGFRIRFGNGEVIDFYADKSEDKTAWMQVLSEVIGKDTASGQKGWTEMILQKERQERKAGVPPRPSSEGNDQASRAPFSQPRHAAHQSMDSGPRMRPQMNVHSTKSVPSSPVKGQVPVHMQTNASPTKPHHGRTRSQIPDAASAMEQRRKKVRSMIF
ncbi:DUF1709-domain-containing protein [Eremomyces bilateralis CBS 781.70]|uniref:DUF1709-domain-containing protein n=1 Tax=Eremomyces bilateralis CBS 781.70 TaxID=1392243 RepID=A0A6G1FU28_9PEZI|nr:DUF1709-domain-containing protein [Eremomyces bilateralis CBS 781.70]KAF1809171.1 DUF1709-domain-containing protein [Eremomyces bilateralis CBS 781.70]